MFSCIPQERFQIVTMPSWMDVWDISYTHIKVQVSIIDLMLLKKVPDDSYPLDGIKKGESVRDIHLQACPSTNNS